MKITLQYFGGCDTPSRLNLNSLTFVYFLPLGVRALCQVVVKWKHCTATSMNAVTFTKLHD